MSSPLTSSLPSLSVAAKKTQGEGSRDDLKEGEVKESLSYPLIARQCRSLPPNIMSYTRVKVSNPSTSPSLLAFYAFKCLSFVPLSAQPTDRTDSANSGRTEAGHV